MINCAVVVQTCDLYERFWSPFFAFMDRHWSKKIDLPIYFCNEGKDVDLPDGFKQLKTGSGTFVQNLNFIISEVKQDNIFYMLEDFWPTSPMRSQLFFALYDVFLQNKFDALQVSSFTPYYNLESSNYEVLNKKLLKFKPESDWTFNFQSRFWKKESLKKCLVEPVISEKKVSSNITVEIASDKIAKDVKLQAYLYHYIWYPFSGAVYRGELNEEGKILQNIFNIDTIVKQKFSQ